STCTHDCTPRWWRRASSKMQIFLLRGCQFLFFDARHHDGRILSQYFIPKMTNTRECKVHAAPDMKFNWLAVATNRRHSNRSVQRLMSPIGQTAKNSRKALTSELPPITDMVRPRGNALRIPSASKSFSVFEKKSPMVRRDFSRMVPETLQDLDGR